MYLTSEQQLAIERGNPVPVNVDGIDCVLVRKEVFYQLDPDYDTGDWTVEEMNLLADEAEKIISESETHED